MTTIDIHTHFIPRFVMDEAAREEGLLGIREDDGWLVHPEGFRYRVAPEFFDARSILAQMDRTGIDIAVLSSSPTLFFYESRSDEVVDFSRRSNDALAELIAGHERLRGLGTLPLQSAEQAAIELERAVTELGFVGAQIGTSYAGGQPLDGPQLEPVFATAEALDVPLMLHPYYVGLKPMLEDFYLTNSIGNPLDTCLAAARLIFAGTLDRFSRLKIVLVHGGGFMPYQLGRFDHAFMVRAEARTGIKIPPSQYLRRFWMDTITHSDAALAFLATLIGEDRVVLGTDLPFDMADLDPISRLHRVGIDPHVLGSTTADLLRC
jgi:aminocarboxymuconate-semialdehyde decarboxylase